MLLSKKSHVPSEGIFGYSPRTQECSNFGNKPIHQVQYVCQQCFQYDHGICKYCFNHCHQQKLHTFSKLLKPKAFFICECSLQKHKPKTQIPIYKCIFTPLNQYFKKSTLLCQVCDISLCFYCQTNCNHPQEHFKHQQSTGQECQCAKSHLPSQYMEFVRKNCKIFEKKRNDSNKLLQLLNCTIENQDIFNCFYAKMRDQFNFIQDRLEYGSSLAKYNWTNKEIESDAEIPFHEKVGEVFNDKCFPYQNIFSCMNLIKNIYKKIPIDYVSERLWDCLPQEYLIFFIVNFNYINSNLNQSSQINFNKFIQLTIKIQMISFKSQFQALRFINCLDLENSNVLTRRLLKIYNQKQKCSYKFVYIYELIKKINKIVFDLEFSNPLLYDFVLFALRCIKIGLNTRLLDDMKLVCKVLMNFEKLCKDIEYYNQQKNTGQLASLLNEKVFNLIGQIVILTYFQRKDQLLLEKITKQFQKSNVKQFSFTKLFFNMFYTGKDKSDFLQNLLYNNSDEQILVLARIFTTMVIHPNLEDKYYLRQQQSQNKLNQLIQIFIREQLFINSCYYAQLQSLQIEDWLAWQQSKLQSDEPKISLIIDYHKELTDFLEDGFKFNISIEGLMKISKSTRELINDPIFLIFQQFKQEFTTNSLTLNFWDIRQIQTNIFNNGLDILIMRFLQLIIHCDYDWSDYQINNQLQNTLSNLLKVLYSFGLYNQLFVGVIYQNNNLNIFTKLMDRIDLIPEVINFHYNLLYESGFMQAYQSCFLSPTSLIKHFYNLNLIIDKQYRDCSEISITKATQIVQQKSKLIQLLYVSLEKIIYQNEQHSDFKTNSHITQFLYDTVLLEIAVHLIELFMDGNTQSIQSSYENILDDKKQINRYAKISLHEALDQLPSIEQVLSEQSPSFVKQNSQQSYQNSPPQQQSFHSAMSLGMQFTLKQLQESLQSKTIELTQTNKLAISTIILTHNYIKFMTLIIDYTSRYQLLNQLELSEQATLVEKIEQCFSYIQSDYKRNLLYQGPLTQIQELEQQMEQYILLINYTKDHKIEKNAPIIYVPKDLNISYNLSCKIMENVRCPQKIVIVLKQFIQRIYNLKNVHEIQNNLLGQNAIILLIEKELRNKSKMQTGQIFINLLVELMQYQTKFQNERNIEYLHSIFMDQINYIMLLQKILIVETKPIQQTIRVNMEENEKFLIHFRGFITYISQKIMPQLFSNVVQYQEQPYISIVTESGQLSIVLLEFIRYLAEGQNSFLQSYVGGTGALEQILKLLIDLLRSKQITEILRETKHQKNYLLNSKAQFLKAVQMAIPSKIQKKGSATEYLRQFLNKKKTIKVKNEFLSFEIHTTQGAQYGLNVAESFLKLFAHTIITIAEYNQGQQLANQQLTFDYLSKYRVWQVIIQILTLKTNERQQKSINTLRLYIFQLILSLLEDPEKSSKDFQYIMNLVNHKLLEETFTQTYTTLIFFNNLAQNTQQIDLNQMAEKLTEMYKTQLGQDINESLIFDSKMLIKILYQIFKMLNLYASINKEIYQYLQDYKQMFTKDIKKRRIITKMTESAFQFIFNIVGSIEYLDDKNQLETFHFLKPPMCFFLSSESKLQFLTETIDRSNPSSKLASIHDIIPSFLTEMKENMLKYNNSQFQKRLINIAISQNFHHKQFSILLTISNFIVLLLISNNNFSTIQNDQLSVKYQESHQMAQTLSQILLICISMLALICQLFFRMSIYHKLYSKNQEKTFHNAIYVIYKVIVRRDIFQFVLHLIFSIFGTFEPFFFYIQSFLFIYISKTMFSVFEALKLRWVQFLGIFTMLLIILNAYSYIGFRKFTTSFQLNVTIDADQDISEEELLCDTPAHCFLSLVYFGLREGSGLGAHGDVESFYKSSDYYPRFLFDFSFFIIVTLIMLNIINGIIIDTFADLRDQQQRNEQDINNVCVICSLERWQFEKKGLRFQQHQDEIHNLWDYVSFIVYLGEVGKENMNGIETYIYTKIQFRDMSWTPQEQTKLLN